jgi:Do/DeqQ family serine protease
MQMSQKILYICIIFYYSLIYKVNKNLKYFLYGCCFSVLISFGFITVYHYYINPYNHWYNEQVNKAIGVAESDIQFSDRFQNAYRSTTPTDFVVAARESCKAVVFIKSDANQTDQNNTAMNSGSGVIISQDGYIVTNHHVVAGAKNIEVLFSDNRVFVANLIGTDPSTDLALLKVEVQNMDYLVFGNSDSLQIGEWVMAIGNPFRLQSTVTAGIVSAKARNINLLENQGIESFIQTDAAINPGNSGGALINTRGDLVGICSAILSNTGRYEGFSFAIPANLTRKVIADLKEFGVVQRGFLGIEIENVDNEMAKRLDLPEVSGVYLASVFKSGSAADAKLRNEDVVISINGTKTKNTAEFMEQVAAYRPGDVIEVMYVRAGEVMSTKAKLKNQINSTELVAVREDGILKELGFELRDMDSYEKSVFAPNGVVVVSVKMGSIIGNTKMEPGYVITRVNDKEVTSVTALIEYLESQSNKEILFEGIYKKYPGAYPYKFVMP